MEHDAPIHNAATSSWVRGARPAPRHSITLTVALRVDDDRRAALERVLLEVSEPAHANYGRHLSMGQLTELLAVPEERVAGARAHFLAAGATEAVTAPNRDMITVKMPVSAAEAALNTTIHSFMHRERGRVRILRASSPYSLPADVARHVAMVGELLQFPRLRPRLLRRRGAGTWPNACAAGGCSGLVTPAVLAQRYKLPETSASGGGGNSMAVAEFQSQFFQESDLATFSKSCHRDVQVDKVIGKNVSEGGIEAELDIEYIRSVAPEVPLTVVYNGDYSLLQWANEISSLDPAPYVHSVSYGNDEQQQSSAQYMLTCNIAFMKAGARGLSILFASGDQGVCGREGCGIFRFRFKPDFPAGSPYVTAVGGTNFAGTSIGEETAWNDSGGGFSDTFAMPDYQKAAVAAYKGNPAAKLPPQRFWNGTGRGYPDVSALGGLKDPYCVTVSGIFTGVAGTSAASPVVAGVFARLNGLRLAAQKPPLGFLNPFIYGNPSGFQDVTSGTNNAGRRWGFTAVKGWDPATGFGTPDFEALAKLAVGASAAAVAAPVVV